MKLVADNTLSVHQYLKGLRERPYASMTPDEKLELRLILQCEHNIREMMRHAPQSVLDTLPVPEKPPQSPYGI